MQKLLHISPRMFSSNLFKTEAKQILNLMEHEVKSAFLVNFFAIYLVIIVKRFRYDT